MMKNLMMKNILFIFIFGVAVSMFCACDGDKKTEGVNPEADSIQDVLNKKQAEMDQMNLFLDAVNTSMDSIDGMSGNIIQTNGESKLSVQEQIKAHLKAYWDTSKRQHERITMLEKSLSRGNGNKEATSKMLQTIESLKKQLEEKDSTIHSLTAELDKRNYDIKALQENVEKLNGNVAELTAKNKEQEATIQAQIDEMNECYYIIGTKRDLKTAGILSGSSLFRKSRLTLNEANAHNFRKVDMRKIDKFVIPGQRPQVLTQEPAGSYTITHNNDGTSTLNITDAKKFWYYTNYIVIRY